MKIVANLLVRLPRRLAPMLALVGALNAAGCNPPPPERGAHFQVAGEGRHSWSAAADQVLRKMCGIEPTNEQTIEVGELLKSANEEHLRLEVPGVISSDSRTPMGVDHRLGTFFGETTEIFIPGLDRLCPRSRDAESPAASAVVPAPADVVPEIVEPIRPDAVETAPAAPPSTPPTRTRPPRPRDTGPTSSPETVPPPTTTPNVVIPQ